MQFFDAPGRNLQLDAMIEDGEMTQWLKALTALSENPYLVPSTNPEHLTNTYNSISMRSNALF